jgi:hypothetical protein
LSVAVPWYARAEDEDTSSQVYLVFDPETGQFITSHDPSAALPTQTGLESSEVSARRHPAGGGDGTNASDGGKPMLFAAAAAVVVLGGASFAFVRSRRKTR